MPISMKIVPIISAFYKDCVSRTKQIVVSAGYMNIPTTAEGLTRLLRAKTTTPDMVYEIASQFDTLSFYFPNQEIFILELIQDRWNDQKKSDFKYSYKIWDLFNIMWTRINDDIILKKLFKNLKFIALLENVLSASDIDLNMICPIILRTCILINSTSTIEVSLDHGCKILYATLQLILKTDVDRFTETDRNKLIKEMITLIGFDNIGEINHKMSITYCNDLLLATLRYFAYYKEHTDVASDKYVMDKLSSYLGKFLFSREISPLLLLETFFKKNSSNIENDVAIILFKESNRYLSKENFKQLESIFEYVISAQPSVVVTLLKELSTSKKTMSHPFLEKLYLKVMEDAAVSLTYDTTFWELVGLIFDLDLEIGIENSSSIMKVIEGQRKVHPENKEINVVWNKFLRCYINAREFPAFLEMWNKYCTDCGSNSGLSIFLTDHELTNEVSKNLATLSISQMKNILTETIDALIFNTKSKIYFETTKIYLHGLQSLSYTILPEFKGIFSKIFEVDTESLIDLWDIKYLIMQIYDDIIPQEQIDSLSEEKLHTILDKSIVSKDVFFFFFKLREYKDFDITLIVDRFIEFLNRMDSDEQKIVLQELLYNWASLVNTLFSKQAITEILHLIVSKQNISILDSLFCNDDFYEEKNIMFNLVSELTKERFEVHHACYLVKIPLQYINKNIRISVIDRVVQMPLLEDIYFRLLDHLLSSPTFKTKIETDFQTLFSIVDQMLKILPDLSFNDTSLIFNKIWKNHLSQSKETVSENFITEVTQKVAKGIQSDHFSMPYYSMGSSIIRLSPNVDVKEFKDTFVNRSLHWIKRTTTDEENITVSWLSYNLYLLFKDAPVSEGIKTTLLSITSEAQSIPNMKLKKSFPSLVPLFLLYTTIFEDRLEILYSQYICLRESGITEEILLPAVADVIERKLRIDSIDFNKGLISTIFSLKENTTLMFYSSMLELLQIQISKIEKENITGRKLFVKFISELFTNITHFEHNEKCLLEICNLIARMQITKPWLFSQYCIELLFPFCLKLSQLDKPESELNDEIFIATTRIVSNILLLNRIKLSNRNHLVNSLLCEYLEIICLNRKYKLTSNSAMSLSRLIINFCEPSSTSTANPKITKNLTSNISFVKKSIRKHVPVLLIKYVHLNITRSLEADIRKELIPAIYAMLDLISLNELNLINSILDNAGSQYFKVLYSDYKRLGKWHES